jgi:antirestriction protein ArdC
MEELHMSQKIYEMVTNKIIEQLEQGSIPWRKPWVNGQAVNWKTQKPYRGINTMLLQAGEYATFKQITEAGGKVKKGAKSEIVVFWTFLEKEDSEGEINKIPFLRYYRVFNIETQAEGIEPKRKTEQFEHDPLEQCENIIKGYKNAPKYTFEGGRAYYSPMIDLINVPPTKDFPKLGEYYSTMFHEMVHSTGHKSRLDREGVTVAKVAFGDEVYSKEELVAEIGASMLCGVAGIDNDTMENSISYIQSWLKQLKNDKTLIVKASGQAQRAVDHILNIEWNKEA